jgi:hypothetical protein
MFLEVSSALFDLSFQKSKQKNEEAKRRRKEKIAVNILKSKTKT